MKNVKNGGRGEKPSLCSACGPGVSGRREAVLEGGKVTFPACVQPLRACSDLKNSINPQQLIGLIGVFKNGEERADKTDWI